MNKALREYNKRERAKDRRKAIDAARRYLAKKQLDRENRRGHIICTINAIAAGLFIVASFLIYADVI